jgi:SAM-dependent methyltransferase
MAICVSCGLGWQQSQPSIDELNATYEGLRDAAYMGEAENRRRAAGSALRVLQRYRGDGARTLLDVGCSAGFFLETAVEAGWDATGVEPSRWMAERARERLGARVLTTTLEAARLEGRRFDVVTMWDVLEHVRSPSDFIAQAKRHMAPGALLAINVPARDTLVARCLGRRWPLLLPEHLYYFTRTSLRALLERAGFEVLGFHAHVVQFSVGYVASWLSQHGWPAFAPLERALRSAGASGSRVPLVIGERTIVARLTKSDAAASSAERIEKMQ